MYLNSETKYSSDIAHNQIIKASEKLKGFQPVRTIVTKQT